MGMQASEIGAVGSSSQLPFPENLCPLLVRLWRREKGNGWLLVWLEGSTRQRGLSPLNPSDKPTPISDTSDAPASKSISLKDLQKKKKMILDMKGLRRLNYKLTQKIQKQKGSTLIDLYPALHASQKYSFCRSSPAQKIPLCRDPSPFIQGSP